MLIYIRTDPPPPPPPQRVVRIEVPVALKGHHYSQENLSVECSIHGRDKVYIRKMGHFSRADLIELGKALERGDL